MNELITALGRRALPAIVEVNSRDGGVRSWLELGAFQVSQTSTAERFVLANINLQDFVAFQKYDFERFSLSSHETMAFCTRDSTRPKAIGWPLLKVYYAAFFGAHALMRSVGQAVIRVETNQAKRLTELAHIFGVSTAVLTAGNYLLRLRQASTSDFEVELTKIADTGGAHDSFWRCFKKFLDQIAIESADQNLPDSADIIAQISDLLSAITNHGTTDGTWLSIVRNQINYQHQYGVWFPFLNAKPELRKIATLGYQKTSTMRLDFDSKKEPIKSFWSAAIAIAALNFDVAEFLIAQSQSKSALFIRNWKRLTS